MDDPAGGSWKIESDGLHVAARRGVLIASLRYFDRDGLFAAAVRQCTGQPVPRPLQAIAVRPSVHDGEAVLAWRSPTETLFLCSGGSFFAEVGRSLAAAVDGCIVDQTGGMSIMDVRGRRAVDLLQRMGARTGIPETGEARASRMAEVHVLTVSIRPGEYSMLVERPYAAHVVEWVRLTAADLS